MASKHICSGSSVMDTLPEDLIGFISSHLDSARSVAKASATCRKWHDAALHHLHKLTFSESDFPKQVGHIVPGPEGIIVSKLVMKTSCLQELSISADSNITFAAARVIEWLVHTRKTLKSLVFMNCMSPPVNILEFLGGNLEKLRWKSAYIPLIDPTILCFQSLTFLHLSGPNKLTFGNLKALIIACPKLKDFELMGAHIWPDVGAPDQRTLELVSSSLKVLKIEKGLIGVDNLVLCVNFLVHLSLKELTLKLLKLVGRNALQVLHVVNTEVAQVHFDDAASRLQTLAILARKNVAAECAKYHEVMSGARNLRTLALFGRLNTTRSSVDLRTMASSFQRVRHLIIDYENAFDAFTSHDSIKFPFLEKVTHLRLQCSGVQEGFVQWVGESLERCPGLQWLMIGVCRIKGLDMKVLGRLITSMLQILC